MMKTVTLIFLVGFIAFGADPTCSPPPAVVESLMALFRHENGLGRNQPYEERFSYMQLEGWNYLRQNSVPEHYDPSLLPVWIFDPNSVQTEANCSSDALWIDCAIYEGRHADEARPVLQGNEVFHYPPAGVTPTVCEYVLDVPRWVPSPDSAEKRRLAADLLHEFQSFGYRDARRITIRDFNFDDPEITAYIVSRRGEEEFQGCTFTRDKTPHCAWHMFGQAPRSGLKRTVMSRPYQLFPSASARR
jgi:hypothetical protein